MNILLFFAIGAFLAFILNDKREIFLASTISLTGGILLAYICFEMLPVAFNMWGLYKSVIFILIAVMLTSFIEHQINIIGIKNNNKNNFFKFSAMLAIVIAVHNLPEGLALGAMYNHNPKNTIKLSILIGLHCLPESFSYALISNANKIDARKTVADIFKMTLPLLFGIFIGAFFTTITTNFVATILSLTGGVMLYITCGDVIPETHKLGSGVLTSIFSVVGFVIGIIIIFLL